MTIPQCLKLCHDNNDNNDNHDNNGKHYAKQVTLNRIIYVTLSHKVEWKLWAKTEKQDCVFSRKRGYYVPPCINKVFIIIFR